MMKRVMCIWFPHWPLQETLARRPEWADHPIVLHTAGGRSGSTVALRSRKAAARGVKPGMPLAQARAFLDFNEPTPKYEQLNPLVHRSALQHLAHWCLRFSPVVGIEETSDPECIFLDIAGCDHLFGGEQKMADHVAGAFADRRFVARVAVADTIGAAWAVAHYGKQTVSVIPPGQHAGALQSLPVEALRIAPAVVAKLRQLDVCTIGRLQALPRQSLPSRFGLEVLRRLDQALGYAPELIETIAPPAPVEAEWSFLYPTTDRRVLETTIRKLIAEVVAQAEAKNHGINRLTCRLVGEGREEVSITVRLLQPGVSVERLFELVRLQIEKKVSGPFFQKRLPTPFFRIHIKVELAPLEICQYSFFDDADQLHHRRERAMFIERLASRLGPRCIVRPQWSINPLPELAVSYASALQEDAKPKKKRRSRKDELAFRAREKKSASPLTPYPLTPRSQTPVWERPSSKLRFADEHVPKQEFGNEEGEVESVQKTVPFRPTYLMRQPLSIEVMSVVPDGPPIRFFRQGRAHIIARCWGPERIETGWWRHAHVRRDYYRVETASGQRFWLFRDNADGGWFLHGIFA